MFIVTGVTRQDNINEILKVLEEEEGFKTDGISGALVWLWNRCIEYQELLHKWNICSSELYTDIGDRNWSAQVWGIIECLSLW